MPGDSGKRFKLKTTEANGPIGLVFNISADDHNKLYRVIGKFSNLTDALNTVGGDLKAFRFETGCGIGKKFMGSSAEDGLSFGMEADGLSKITVGTLDKFPGGLLGGWGAYFAGNKDDDAYSGDAYVFADANADGDGLLSLTEVAEADPSRFPVKPDEATEPT